MKKIAVERWSGKAWYPVLLSPFKTIGEVHSYLEKYQWHFTSEYPYRIKDFKPKAKPVQRSIKSYQNWNSDEGMVTGYSS